MTDAPERIWATVDIDISAQTTDIYAQDTPDGFVGNPVEYTRADIPVKVKPLVWGFRTILEGEVFGVWMYAGSIVGAYEIHTFEGRAHSGIAFLQCPNKCGLIEFPTTAEAKAAAQSDYETRIRECLE